MAGLFVQKHVEAVRAQGVDVRVISSYTWLELWQQWRALRREGWMPDVVQLNVIQKQGLLALWLKRRYHIPYVIIEHWSGYLPENGQYKRLPFIQKWLYRHIAKHAETLMTVSQRHAEAMQECGIRNKQWERINNVVDDFFFDRPKTEKQRSEPKTLLHISCFDERAKNVKGLLRAAKALSEKRSDWQLVLVGTGVDFDDVRTYAESLEFPDGLLVWTGELTPREVAIEFDKADIFVLSSNYENAPVVISESLATGTPIIATIVGGIPEMVDKSCGILVPTRDDLALTNAMLHMLDHYQEYDRDTIRQYGKQYAFTTIGQKLKKIYEQACGIPF